MTILDKAPVANGKKEWFCTVCEMSNVCTRKKSAQIFEEPMATKLFRFHKQAPDEQYVPYKPSSSDERIGKVATQCRFEAEQERKHKELEVKVAKLEAELKAASASTAQQAERNGQLQRLSLRIVSPWKRRKTWTGRCPKS